MNRLLLSCAVAVLLCAVLASAEAKTNTKALLEKLAAARRNKVAAATKDVDARNLRALVQRRLAAAKEKVAVTHGNRFELKRNGGAAPNEACNMVKGAEVLDHLLAGGSKRGIDLFAKSTKHLTSTKKSYEEVFMAGEYILGASYAFAFAPCSVGVLAGMDMMADVDWESIDWSQVTEHDIAVSVLTFVEWWTENKCTEFFTTVDDFFRYVWAIFWDDLEETECYHQLPQNEDGSVDWVNAFSNVNSMDPAAWEQVPEPTTECELFELVGEIFFDFFFINYFDVLPTDVLEDMFNDYGVNDAIHPYFGYEYFENKYGGSDSA